MKKTEYNKVITTLSKWFESGGTFPHGDMEKFLEYNDSIKKDSGIPQIIIGTDSEIIVL